MIKIAGAGCGKKELPLKVYDELNNNYVILRSKDTVCCDGLRYDQSFDDLYSSAQNFDELYSLMAQRIIDAELEHKNVLYIVGGDGYFDRSVMELFKKRPDVCFLCGQGYPGVYTINVSAYEIENVASLDLNAALKVTEIDSEELCGDVKLKLMEFYHDEEDVWFFNGDKKQIIPLYEIDRQKNYNENTCVVIPPVTRLTNRKYGIDALMRIMDRLTAPDGCEWDKVQTHDSIRINLIEEAYEAVDAINSGDYDQMIEEFGDVLLQAVFHCVIAKNSGEFDFSDVTTALCNKLVTRHTHIFGDDKATDASSALNFWEKAKATEKHYSSLCDQLKRLPQNFPSLLQAQKIYKKLVKNGASDKLNNVDNLTCAQKLFLAVAECAKNGEDSEVVLRELCNNIIGKLEQAEKEGKSISELCISELLC